MSRPWRILLVSILAIPTVILPISSAQAITISAAGDSNGYCNQSVTLGTGTTVVSSISSTTCIVKFTGSGTYTWTRPTYVTNFRALVIGGGGGGGGDYGGGGGAGGFTDTTIVIPLATTSTSVTVGAGGAGNAGGGTSTDASAAGNGETSTIFTVNSAGGGGGGSPDFSTDSLKDGRAGASGGGSGRAGAGTGKSGITGQGSNGGGSNFTGVTVMSGGGGGAAAAGATGGTDVSQSIGGKGGDGKTSDITGTAVYYSGGGGGGTHSSGNTCVRGTASTGLTGGGAYGGAGGGGDAGQCINPGGSSSTGNAGANGTANTGGGGGGGSVYNGRTTNARGGNGGSGVVIISYTYISSIAPVLTLPNGTPLVYRTLITLTATSPTTGKITFYAAGKRIPGCINRSMTASGNNFIATCPWRPSVHGAVKISALISPTDSLGTQATGSTSFEPSKRSGNR